MKRRRVKRKPGKRGIMEKICIVKRRRIGFGTSGAPRPDVSAQTHLKVLTIELTPEHTERVRSNDIFQGMYGSCLAPILLTLHLETHFPMKLLTSEQICDMLQISASTLKRLLRAGAFKSYRIGRLRRFAAEDLFGYLSKNIQIKGLRSVGGAGVP